jgi:hypothetical protein
MPLASEADFKFINGAILQQKEDSPMSKAFNHAGVIDAEDITLLTDRVCKAIIQIAII